MGFLTDAQLEEIRNREVSVPLMVRDVMGALKLDEMSKEEFIQLIKKDDCYKKTNELFDIRCKKCGSGDIEIFGDYDESNCYYPGDRGTLSLVIKCHKCGNAKLFDKRALWDLDGWEQLK